MKKLEMRQMEEMQGGSCALAGAAYVVAGATAVASGGLLSWLAVGIALWAVTEACNPNALAKE